MKINQYRLLKEKQQKEFNTLPLYFAFSQSQWEEILRKIGIKENETRKKLISIGGGGFMLKEDYPKYKEMINKHYNEIQYKIENDKDGTGFIMDMFSYELYNHEYGYTRELYETLESLGLTYKNIEENKNLKNGLNLAISKYEQEEER